MSTFIGSNNSDYEYISPNCKNQLQIPSGMLCILFDSYGYCVDPSSSDHSPLTNDAIDQLYELALNSNDKNLMSVIDNLTNNNDANENGEVIVDINNFNIEDQFTKFMADANAMVASYADVSAGIKCNICDLLREICELGLLFVGWSPQHPYPSHVSPIGDIIRLESHMLKYIDDIQGSKQYHYVKDFPLIYVQDEKVNFFSQYIDSKSNMADVTTIGHAITYLKSSVMDELLIGKFMISTSYFLLVNVCTQDIPTIKRLIHHFNIQ